MPLHAPPDQDIVIVGATGDLAQRKLIPALYNLHRQKLLPTNGEIIGAAPFDWNDQRFRDLAESAVKQFSRTPLQKTIFASFARRLKFVPLTASDDLSPIREASKLDTRIAYLAVPPSAFTPLIEGIKTAALADGTSIIIEKPFGHDLESAMELNKTLHDVVPEPRIFRIDHYMGKETVQNLLVFRFGNSLFERGLEPRGDLASRDHRRRVHRRRSSRQAVRGDRRNPRHRAEPHVPGAVAGRDGPAAVL